MGESQCSRLLTDEITEAVEGIVKAGEALAKQGDKAGGGLVALETNENLKAGNELSTISSQFNVFASTQAKQKLSDLEAAVKHAVRGKKLFSFIREAWKYGYHENPTQVVKWRASKVCDFVFKACHGDCDILRNVRLSVIELLVELMCRRPLPEKDTAYAISAIVQQLDHMDVSLMSRVVEKIVEELESATHLDQECIRTELGNYVAAIEILPLLLSRLSVFKSHSRNMSGESISTSGLQYKSQVLTRLYRLKWPPRFTEYFVKVIKDIPLSIDEACAFARKIKRQLTLMDLNDLPPLVYQIMLLAGRLQVKSCKRLLCYVFIQHMEQLDIKCDELNESVLNEDAPSTQSIRVSSLNTTNLRDIQSRIIVSFGFVAKQDQTLGGLFLQELKKKGIYHSRFSLALLLSLVNIQRFEEPVLETLSQLVLNSYSAEDVQAQSGWITSCLGEDVGSDSMSIFGPSGRIRAVILETIRNSCHGWDEIAPGLVKLGTKLINIVKKVDPIGPIGRSKISRVQVDQDKSAQFGVDMLVSTFAYHVAVRGNLTEYIISMIITRAANVGWYVRLLFQISTTLPNELLPQLNRMKDALEYLSFLSPSIANGILHVLRPLWRLKPELHDDVVLVLRKAMFRREESARIISIRGFLYLLSVAPNGNSGHLLLSQSQGSQAFSISSSHNIQSKIFWEVSGFFRRCLNQQAAVRACLYDGVSSLFQEAPTLRAALIDLVYTHFIRYYESNEAIQPPLRIDLGLGHGKEIKESFPYLIQCILSLHRDLCAQDTEEADISDRYPLDRVRQTIETFIERMASTELEDFELDKNTCFTVDSEIGCVNRQLAASIHGICDAILNHRVRVCTSAEELFADAEKILHLFKMSSKLKQWLEVSISKGQGKKSSENPSEVSDNTQVAVSTTLDLFMKYKPVVEHQSIMFLMNALYSDVHVENGNSGLHSFEFQDFILRQCDLMLQWALKPISSTVVPIGYKALPENCYSTILLTIAPTLLIAFELNGSSAASFNQKNDNMKSLRVHSLSLFEKIMHSVHDTGKLSELFSLALFSVGSESEEKDSQDEDEFSLVNVIHHFQRISRDLIGTQSWEELQIVFRILEYIFVQVKGKKQPSHVKWVQQLCRETQIDNAAAAECILGVSLKLMSSVENLESMKTLACAIRFLLPINSSHEFSHQDLRILRGRKCTSSGMNVLMTEVSSRLSEIEFIFKHCGARAVDLTTSNLEDELDVDLACSSPLNKSHGGTRLVLQEKLARRMIQLCEVFHVLMNTQLEFNEASTALRALIRFYKLVSNFVKWQMMDGKANLGTFSEFFSLLDWCSRTLMEETLMFISIANEQHKQLLLGRAEKKSGKGKKKDAASKPVSVSNSSTKQIKLFPELIFQLEQLDMNIIKMSKRFQDISFDRWIRTRQARDFRLNGDRINEEFQKRYREGDDCEKSTIENADHVSTESDEDEHDSEDAGEDDAVNSPPIKRSRLVP